MRWGETRRALIRGGIWKLNLTQCVGKELLRKESRTANGLCSLFLSRILLCMGGGRVACFLETGDVSFPGSFCGMRRDGSRTGIGQGKGGEGFCWLHAGSGHRVVVHCPLSIVFVFVYPYRGGVKGEGPGRCGPSHERRGLFNSAASLAPLRDD